MSKKKYGDFIPIEECDLEPLDLECAISKLLGDAADSIEEDDDEQIPSQEDHR